MAVVTDVAVSQGMGKQDDDDGRRRYARSLWAKLDRPASLSLNGWKRIVDAEKFIANAGADDLAALIERLEEIAGAG